MFICKRLAAYTTQLTGQARRGGGTFAINAIVVTDYANMSFSGGGEHGDGQT
jgi:hypothetical protein